MFSNIWLGQVNGPIFNQIGARWEETNGETDGLWSNKDKFGSQKEGSVYAVRKLSAVSWLYLFPSGITATSLIFISVVLHTSAQSLIEVRRSPGEHTDHINYYRNTTITLLKYLLHSYSNTTING